jgi:ribosomal protein L25 (general stress protein Ctc)
MAFPTGLLQGMTGFFGQFGQRKRQMRDRKFYENLTKEMQERTFGNNQALMQMQQKFDRGMFDYSNAYNTPQAQMRRLKQAGLNPALMYGQGTTGNTQASMPTADTIPTTFSGAEIAQSAASGAQMSVMNSQVQLNKANAIAKGIDSSVKAGQYGIAKELSQYQMDNLRSDTQVKTQKEQTEVINQELLKIEKQIKSKSAQGIVKKITQEAANLVIDGKIKTEQAYQEYIESGFNRSGATKNDNIIIRSYLTETRRITDQFNLFKNIGRAIWKAYNQ